MATRGGISGAVIGLVICVFLFVITTALAILFFTQKADAQKEADLAKEELAKFVNVSAAQTTDHYQALKQRATTTIYNQMLDDEQQLKLWLAGDPSVTMDELATLHDAAKIGPGLNALSQITALRGELTTEQGKVAAANSAVNKLKAEIDRLGKEIATARDSAGAAQQALDARLGQQKQAYDANVSAVKAERDELNQTYEKSKADFRAQLRTKDGEISGLKTEIAKLEGRIVNLSDIIKKNRLTAPDMTLEPDGQVSRVDARKSVVYINLGRDDRIILGQTFEVFDGQVGVQTERNLKGQTVHVGGKATIEVIRFSEDGKSASARIVRQAFGQPIVAGDLISNIVYDRDRQFRFFVAGDFDVDGDGRATAGERQRINGMVEQWGGVSIDAEKMPVDTDFLVVGEEPPFPQRPDEALATEDDWRRYVEQKTKATAYQELVGQAKELSIPILTQNRFYTLIGFYDR